MSADELHAQVMNLLPSAQPELLHAERRCYGAGHCEARHAAATLAQEAYGALEARYAALETDYTKMRESLTALVHDGRAIAAAYGVRLDVSASVDSDRPVYRCRYCQVAWTGTRYDHPLLAECRTATILRWNDK